MKTTQKRLLCFVLMTVSLGLKAQEVQTLDEVKISATRIDIASDKLRAVNVINSEEIKKMPFASLQELLDHLPGVDVRSRGANGVQADVIMRGGTFDQVMILLNGVNVTDPHTGHLNLDLPVDLSAIERVEVLQGAPTNIFGLYAFSGAINIVTNAEKQAESLEASIEGGDFGFLNASIGAKMSVDKWQINSNAAYNRSEGYMHNTDYQRANLYLQATTGSATVGKWDIQIGGQAKGFGANSFYSLSYPNQYENVKMMFASASWRKTIGQLGLEASAYHRLLQDRFELIRDYKDAPSWYKNHNHHLSNVSGANVKASWYSAIGKSSVGVEVRNEAILSNVLGEERSEPSHVPGQADSIMFTHSKARLNLNYFAEQTFSLEKWTASAGISANYNSMFGHNVAWGLNHSYSFTNDFQAFASFNQARRLPTFTDLYYKSATQIANPNLNPEKSITAEIGTKYEKEKFSTRASLYHRWGRDIIDWIKSPEEEQWRSTNHSKVNALGAEINAAYSHGEWLKKVQATYSFCTLDKQTDEYLSKYALDYLRHKLTIDVSHKIYKNISATWTANYQSRNGEFINLEGQQQSYEPVLTVDGKIYWTKNGVTLYIEASNITNANYYDYGGILQPPIWAKGGIAVKW